MSEHYEECVTERDGNTPLAFTGMLEWEASSQASSGPLQNRWHDVKVYRTRGGKYVLAVRAASIWAGESDLHWAEVCDDAGKVLESMKGHDAMPDSWGYPAGHQFVEKQAALARALRAGWGRLISEAAAALKCVERVD